MPILCQLGKLFKTSLYSLFYKGVWERKTNFCPRQTGLELSLLWTTRENDANPLVPMFRLVPVFEKLEDMDGQPFARWHCYKAHKQSRMARNRKFEPLRCALQITQPSKSETISNLSIVCLFPLFDMRQQSATRDNLGLSPVALVPAKICAKTSAAMFCIFHHFSVNNGPPVSPTLGPLAAAAPDKGERVLMFQLHRICIGIGMQALGQAHSLKTTTNNFASQKLVVI